MKIVLRYLGTEEAPLDEVEIDNSKLLSVRVEGTNGHTVVISDAAQEYRSGVILRTEHAMRIEPLASNTIIVNERKP